MSEPTSHPEHRPEATDGPPADDAVTHPSTPEQTPDHRRPEKDPEGRSPGEASPRSPDDESMDGPAPTG